MSSRLILVTGGLGFIGKHFVAHCLDQGDYVINVDRVNYAADRVVKCAFKEKPNYRFMEVDVCDLEYLPECDIIVNFAAESHVDNAIADNTKFCRSNIIGVQHLLELVRNKQDHERPRFVQISSDEVYGDIVYQGEHLSPLSLPGMADRTVVISSLSKSHAMTGWRIGWAIVPDRDFADHLFNLLLCSLYGLPGFSQRAAISALTQDFPELVGMMDTYRDRRRRLSERLDGLPGMACHAPEGGMFLLLDVRGSGLSAQAFAERLLAEAGVALLPADAFGASAKGHLRLSLGTTDERLDEAAARIEAFASALVRAA